jgi:putative transcriptional regulator
LKLYNNTVPYSPESEVLAMAVSYKKLWKLLIDKDMKKKDLRQATGMSTTSLAKLGKNENINTEILVKICKALECDIGDIMEVTED